MEDNKNKDQQQKENLTDQERLAQAALGNTQADQPLKDNNNEMLSTLKTSGTGSNPSSAAPRSLIVHDDERGEKRYEKGTINNTNREKE